MRALSRLLILGVASALASGETMAGTRATPIQCSVQGEKLLKPLTADAICQRFVTAYARASGAPASKVPAAPADGLVIALRFLPQGVATAELTRMRGGKASPAVSFNLAVSDRPFAAQDIDRLAAEAAAARAAAAH